MQDRLFFEIITKGEIPEHFKKCVMARRIANIIKIIMFPARANAFLRGRSARNRRLHRACKIVFKLNHTRIGKHQSRIIIRNKRT